jgi:hypothetical protein
MQSRGLKGLCVLETLDRLDPFTAIARVPLIRFLFLFLPTDAPEGLLKPIATMPHLEILTLQVVPSSVSSHPRDSALDLRPLRESTSLRCLVLFLAEVDDQAVDSLIEIRGLRQVRLKNCSIGPERLARLRSARPDLRVVEE